MLETQTDSRGGSAQGPRWFRRALWAALAVAVLLQVFETISLRGKIGSDYYVFYEGAQQFLRDPMALYPADAKRTLLGYLYPPPSVFLFLPLLLGTLENSFLWTNAVVLACALAAALMYLDLVRQAHGLARDRLVASVVLGLSLAVGAMLAVRQGQVDTIILLLCVAPVWLDHKRWPRTAGAIIAMGCWIKIYPVLMLFWLCCRPQWRGMAAGFGAAAVGIPLLSLAMVPSGLYIDYFHNQLPSMSGHAIINIDNQSLAGILVRTMAPLADYVRLYTTLPLPAWFRAGIVALMLGGMSAVVWRVRTSGAPALLVASWATALACLVAPLGWGHTYCLLIPLLIHVLRLGLARRCWPEIVVAGGCYAALLLPAHHRLFVDTQIPGWAAQLFYARYALAAVMLLALSWRQARENGVVPCPPATGNA